MHAHENLHCKHRPVPLTAPLTAPITAPITRIVLVALALLAFGFMGVGGCATMRAAAAKDPMRCERDPECLHMSKAYDCPSQCVDDSECVRRCEQVRGHR